MKKPERIQKVLAAAGYGSRRTCEKMVRQGRVKVNGQVCTQLPILVDPQVDPIHVDGRKFKPSKLVYFLLHKPKGVLCTNNDPAGRIRAIDLLHRMKERVYPIGRLDADSTGLLLMTNDGALAERLTHPRYGIEKTYEATVQGRLTPETIEKLKKGAWMSGGRTQSVKVKVLHRSRDRSLLEIKLREGRNRQVRRMLARLGHKVVRLKRITIGNLKIRGLGPGKYRPITPAELVSLKKITQKAENSSAQASPRTGKDVKRIER